MKNTIHIVTVTIFALMSVSGVLGQVPGIITYQGRVTSNGTNFTGNGQFKFALVNAAGGQSLWSNDGTSVNGSQPAALVSAPVTNGLFTVALGDTTLPNMQVIPMALFTNPDVRLRLWFNNGVAGFAQLTPDQRITSVGYAAMSANVLDASITTAKFAPGVFNPTNFPPNTITSNQLADTIALGTSAAGGRLDVYRTGAGTPAVTLLGSSSQIQTFGSDGGELIRLWGPSYGELLLKDSSGHQTAVNLTANGNSGGKLYLYNSNGVQRAVLSGENVGGALTLYQADGSGTGALLDGNDGVGAGSLTLYQSDSQVGVSLYGEDAGTGGGALSLRNAAGNPRLRADGGSGGGSLAVYHSNSTQTITLTGDSGTVAASNFQANVSAATAPGFAFIGDSNTGLFSPAANTVAIATAGFERMRVNSSGNVGIGTNAPQSALHVVGTVTATAFNPPSDRNLKENFTPVSPREVLDKITALPISRWNFIGDTATLHVGPMAQDFHAAFGLGTDDKHIATVDADGVALAAIQGLNQKMEEQRAELKQKQTEITDLKRRLEKLEQLMNEKNRGAK